jgi:hypothetical protein
MEVLECISIDKEGQLIIGYLFSNLRRKEVANFGISMEISRLMFLSSKTGVTVFGGWKIFDIQFKFYSILGMSK